MDQTNQDNPMSLVSQLDQRYCVICASSITICTFPGQNDWSGVLDSEDHRVSKVRQFSLLEVRQHVAQFLLAVIL